MQEPVHAPICAVGVDLDESISLRFCSSRLSPSRAQHSADNPIPHFVRVSPFGGNGQTVGATAPASLAK